ncbi:MAG: arginine N-succinyltransferase, partial [Phycisphaerales bacterium]|nr:arginine N-succinyltransferase [Phycisphaerales bacterium]
GFIEDKVAWSRQSFLLAQETAVAGRPAKGKQNGRKGVPGAGHDFSEMVLSVSGRPPQFLFVMEETESKGVIGSSQIIAQMGGPPPGQPNLSLQLSRKEMFSESLQTGATHTVAKLHLDQSGPTEIGGLIMQPSFRGHRQKLGRLMSLVRFHYIGLYRQMFASRVLAEMMGVVTVDREGGKSPFWEHCTRQFINLTYDQADAFCADNKEFILSLFPREEIYLSLLPPQARAVVGQVGPETVPAKKMLEKLGFKYHMRVDPFDGGPHIECATDSISLVQQTRRLELGKPFKDGAACKGFGIVSVVDGDGEFVGVQTPLTVDRQERLSLPRAAWDLLHAEGAQEGAAGYTALDAPGVESASARRAVSR